VASLFFTSSLSNDKRCSLKSSAGEGNPAEIPVSKNKAPGESFVSSGAKSVKFVDWFNITFREFSKTVFVNIQENDEKLDESFILIHEKSSYYLLRRILLSIIRRERPVSHIRYN
jgi:hypothetical protein